MIGRPFVSIITWSLHLDERIHLILDKYETSKTTTEKKRYKVKLIKDKISIHCPLYYWDSILRFNKVYKIQAQNKIFYI